MKTTLAALLLLSLASPAFTDEASVPATPVGHLEVSDRAYDVGKVERGVTVRHVFLLKNAGTADLSIDAKPG